MQARWAFWGKAQEVVGAVEPEQRRASREQGGRGARRQPERAGELGASHRMAQQGRGKRERERSLEQSRPGSVSRRQLEQA